MKKHLLLCLFVGISLCAGAQNDNQLVIGTIDSLHSDILKETRKVWVYVPDSGPDGIYSRQRYPVVYLLDGDAHFTSVVGMIEQMSSVNGNDLCPKMIVVGIPNTDRMRDLSPTHVDSSPFLNPAQAKTTGGGEAFLSFIEKELMPYVESKYPTAPYRMLIGHSLGGLLAVHTFLHHTDLFNAYVAIDPSMWWDDRKLLKEAQKDVVVRKFPKTALYMGIANTMESGMDIRSVVRDTSNETEHIRSILTLDKLLNNNKQNKLKYRSKYYGNDTHNSAPLITEYDALRFIFDYYPMKLRWKDYEDTTGVVAEKIEKACALRSEKMGYAIKPPEDLYNSLGYQALGNKHFALAEHYFKQNTEYYPESFNVYDSYGDYFLAKEDKANAIVQFQKSLAIKETPATRQKLKSLQKK
jgi:hypothetical protein